MEQQIAGAGTTVTLDLSGSMHFLARREDGLTVSLDSTAAHGGSGRGLTPRELMLAALGGCTGMDVISILRKKRQNVTSYRVEVSGVKANDYPHVYTAITVRHVIQGVDLKEEAVRRAIELSETKYCPAYAMLAKSAAITSSFEVQPAPAD